MAARAPVEQLAALSDDQAAAAIRTAAADVLAAVQVWRVRAMLAGVGHRTRRARRGRRRRQRAGRSVRRCRAGAVVDAVGPLVRTWWPAGSGLSTSA